MWFGYNPQIIFYHFFCYFNLGIFLAFLLSKLMDTGYLVYYQSEWIVGTLCAHLLLQFYIDSFETSQVFWTWSEDLHVVWI